MDRFYKTALNLGLFFFSNYNLWSTLSISPLMNWRFFFFLMELKQLSDNSKFIKVMNCKGFSKAAHRKCSILYDLFASDLVKLLNFILPQCRTDLYVWVEKTACILSILAILSQPINTTEKDSFLSLSSVLAGSFLQHWESRIVSFTTQ